MTSPSWAISIELCFYFFISLGLGRNFKVVIYWFFLSLLFHFFALIYLDYDHRYFTVLAASLPFSTGALIWHISQKKEPASFILSIYSYKQLWLVLALCSYLIFLPIYFLLAFYWKVESAAVIYLNIEFYTSFVLLCLIITSYSISDKGLFSVSKRIDSILGDLSYPIYLFHFHSGIIASYIIWGAPERGLNFKGLTTLPLAIMILFTISFLMLYMEKPIKLMRNLVRPTVK